MCDYTHDPKGDFNWSRNKGPTASVSTGPTTDHTLQTDQGKNMCDAKFI